MANQLFDVSREKFLKGEIDWLNDDIFVSMVDTTGVSGILAYTTMNDFAPGKFKAPTDGVIAGIQLTGKTATSGAANAAGVTFTAVAADANQLEALIIWTKPSGTTLPSEWIPIAYIDSAVGLPITPNGGDIIVVWDTGGNKIFKL